MKPSDTKRKLEWIDHPTRPDVRYATDGTRGVMVIEGTKTPDPDVRYIVAGKSVVKITRVPYVDNPNYSFFQDDKGTVYAVQELDGESDLVERCGIGIFSLPEGHPFTVACIPHDYSYSSPAAQAFKTRKWADAALYEHLLQQGASKLTAGAMWLASRIGGFFAWENSRTR